MEDLIIITVIAVVVGIAAFYIYKAKKNGKKCIGCPSKCSGSCNTCSGCKNSNIE